MANDLVLTAMPAAGPITTRFGDTIAPNGRAPYRHVGIDIGCAQGTPVFNRARNSTRVHAVYDDPNHPSGFGRHVILDYDDTVWYAVLAHLSRIDVVEGAMLPLDKQIGLSGATGFVEGAHLHYQLSDAADFPKDLSRSADPFMFVESEPASPLKLEDRIARLEALLAGNGIDVEIDGKVVRLTGEKAVAESAARGWSAFLGIGELRANVVIGAVGEHTHVEGGVKR